VGSGQALGRFVWAARQRRLHAGRSRPVWDAHIHSDHVGGPTEAGRKRVFPNARCLRRQGRKRPFGIAGKSCSGAEEDAAVFPSAQAIAAPDIKGRGKWHHGQWLRANRRRMQIVPLHGHTPGHDGYEFSSKGTKNLFWGDIIMHSEGPTAAYRGHSEFRHRPDWAGRRGSQWRLRSRARKL